MKSPFWLWEDALPISLCDLLLQEMQGMEEIDALVGVGDGEYDELRDSKVSWAKQNHWIEGILYNHAVYANEKNEWVRYLGRPELVQLTRYKKGGQYHWHEDWHPLEESETVRKLSVVALLSDPSEFSGGQFEIKDTEVPPLKKGSILVFPSYLMHRVAPVSDGVRMSAVCWVRGPCTH